MNNLPIGVFDSGIGGLTVAKEMMRELPHERIIYLGDTARVPYGTRGKEVITKFALELTRFLLKEKNLLNINHKIKHRFLVTDATDRLYQIVNLFFDNKFPGELKKVEI